MKQVVLLALLTLTIPAVLLADGKKKSGHKAGATEKGPTEIQWITSVDELQAKMAKNPKKVYMDVYTGWCGWCKKMDAATFTNPDVIRYMNAHFYAVKLDAERQDTIHFMGSMYYYEPRFKVNTFAAKLMLPTGQGQLGYPTSIFMLENFQSPEPVPGYHDVKDMECYLTYYGDNIYKHKPLADFQKEFKQTWKEVGQPDMAPPPGH